MNEILKAISAERLETYRTSANDTTDDLMKRYLHNIQIAESLYPALSLLEITLRNHLYRAIEQHIKPNWLIDELSNRSILHDIEFELLKKAQFKLTRPVYKQKIRTIPELTTGKLMAEMSFGFWVYLCDNKYNPTIWMKKPLIFDEVFPNFDTLTAQKNPDAKRHKRINSIAHKLKTILTLRNRVFHHEPVFNHPLGIENCHCEIEELLMYMSLDIGEKFTDICRFNEFCPKNAKT